MTTDNRPNTGLQYTDLGVGRMTCDERSVRVTAGPAVEPGLLTAAVRDSGYNAFVRGSAGE